MELEWYEKLVIDKWKECNKDWFNIYLLNENDLFEFLWAFRMTKRTELNGISKPKIKYLANMIKNGKAPRDMNTYLIAMNKKEKEESEKLSKYFYYIKGIKNEGLSD